MFLDMLVLVAVLSHFSPLCLSHVFCSIFFYSELSFLRHETLVTKKFYDIQLCFNSYSLSLICLVLYADESRFSIKL